MIRIIEDFVKAERKTLIFYLSLDLPKSLPCLFLHKLPLKSYPCAENKGSLCELRRREQNESGRDL